MVRRNSRRRVVEAAAPALPNVFTLGNLAFGICAIIWASHGEFWQAVLFVVLGGVCDAFDGQVARATGTGSRFGEELDSLVDAISFGLAPALIAYYSVLNQDHLGWLPVCLFTAAAVLRLARFNVTQAGGSKTYFIGMPSPAAGGTLATYYWFSQTPLYRNTGIVDLPWQTIIFYLMLLLAGLMVSPVPYPAWPRIGYRNWRGLLGLVLMVGIVVGVASPFRTEFFFLFGVAYLLFGLLRWFIVLFVEGGRATLRLEGAEDAVPEMTDEAPLPPRPRRPTPGPSAVAAVGPTVASDYLAGEGREFDDASPETAAGPRRRRRRRRRGHGHGSDLPTRPPLEESGE